MTSNTLNTQYPQSSLEVSHHNSTQYTSHKTLSQFLTISLIKFQLHIIQYQCQIYPTSMYETPNVITHTHTRNTLPMRRGTALLRRHPWRHGYSPQSGLHRWLGSPYVRNINVMEPLHSSTSEMCLNAKKTTQQ